MNRISKAISDHIVRKHNLTVNVNENEGIVSMKKETFTYIMTEYAQLIYANICYVGLLVSVLVAVSVIMVFL